MGKTTIRLPDVLHQRIKALALKERRSMRMQIIYMLEFALRVLYRGKYD